MLRHPHIKYFPFPATQRRGRIKKCPYRVATGMFDEYAEHSRNNRCRNVKGKEKKKTDRQERKGQGNSGHAGCRRSALCRPAKRAGTPRSVPRIFLPFFPSLARPSRGRALASPALAASHRTGTLYSPFGLSFICRLCRLWLQPPHGRRARFHRPPFSIRSFPAA